MFSTFYLIFNFYFMYLCFLFEDAVLFVFFFSTKKKMYLENIKLSNIDAMLCFHSYLSDLMCSKWTWLLFFFLDWEAALATPTGFLFFWAMLWLVVGIKVMSTQISIKRYLYIHIHISVHSLWSKFEKLITFRQAVSR